MTMSFLSITYHHFSSIDSLLAPLKSSCTLPCYRRFYIFFVNCFFSQEMFIFVTHLFFPGILAKLKDLFIKNNCGHFP